MYNWRLVTELDAFVYLTEKKVLLVPAEKVSTKKRSLTISGLCNKEKPLDVALSTNEFEIKFSDSLVPLIRNKELPGGKDVWYELINYVYYNDYPYENYYRKEISKLLKQDGIFQGLSGFEAVFSDEYPGKVKLLRDGMDEYDNCFSEMTRRLNCSLYKKTKKWIPGHRYDSENRTYYYLGSYYSNRENLYESSYKNNLTEYHLVTEVKGDCKTISDVFKTKIFGSEPNNIIVIDAIKPMVDSGEVLKDDVSNIQDLWKEMIELAVKEKSAKPMFDVIGFRGPEFSSATKYKDTSSWVDIFVSRLMEDLKSTAIIYWNIGNVVKENNRMNANESDEFNINALWDLYCEEFLKNDFNCRKIEYYLDLLDSVEIHVHDICLDIINLMKSGSFTNSSFDNYLKYGKDYFRFRDNHGNHSFVYAKSGSKLYDRSSNEDKISERFPPLLAQAVSDLAREAVTNYGNGVSEYSVENYGTKSSPDIFHEITISVDDIVSHFGGLEQVPDQLKQEIMDKHVWKISILLGQDIKLS